jgi:hypothetical protein
MLLVNWTVYRSPSASNSIEPPYAARIHGDGNFKLFSSPGVDSKELIPPAYVAWDGIFKLLKTPGIDSKESIPPAYVA